MVEKGLRRLNRMELLRLLLAQCEEMERLEQEYESMKAEMGAFMESYERLKGKLDIKDRRLNEKDAEIAELRMTVEELKTAENAGKAVLWMNQGETKEQVGQSLVMFQPRSRKVRTPIRPGREAETVVRLASSGGMHG